MIFKENPAHLPYVERAVENGMRVLQAEIKQYVVGAIYPIAVRAHAPIKVSPVDRTLNEVRGRLSYGRGFGPIFESGTKQRFTKTTGANRGRISSANHAMQKGRVEAARRGLNLTPYLH